MLILLMKVIVMEQFTIKVKRYFLTPKILNKKWNNLFYMKYYMHGVGLDADVRSWCVPAGARRHRDVPRTTVAPGFVPSALPTSALTGP